MHPVSGITRFLKKRQIHICFRKTPYAWILPTIHREITALSVKKREQCSQESDCNNLHFFFTKLCDVITRRCCCFSFPQCSTSRKCLFLYLTLMWQTVRFVISAKDIKCLLIQIGRCETCWENGREREEDVKAREMSIREECLSKQVVYTSQTLIITIIILIIICKGHSKQSGYLSAANEPRFTLDSSVSVNNSLPQKPVGHGFVAARWTQLN